VVRMRSLVLAKTLAFSVYSMAVGAAIAWFATHNWHATAAVVTAEALIRPLKYWTFETVAVRFAARRT
jgi:uncharacterized membrane protein